MEALKTSKTAFPDQKIAKNPEIYKKSKSVKEVRPSLDECVLQNGKKIYLIGKGRLANLVAAEGHPPEVMAQSFSNQILSLLYIYKNHKKIKPKNYL